MIALLARIALFMLATSAAACAAPSAPLESAARPGPSDSTHYVLARGALLTCNSWGFDTVCH